ncbi:MAG TPA: hypothetical protein VK791_00430 [bacterium]|jgi:hypothetical protein|nr:hypothetical protein [bacterium]
MKRFCLSIILLLVNLATLWAVTPAEYFNSLVAGGDQEGYRDGVFVTARFNHPIGMAFNEAVDKIYVADSGNDRIRVVDLKNNNDVQTIVGTGSAGQDDGSFDKASFNTPTRLVALPQDKLAVYDAGSHLIRLIDLKTKSVSTLIKDVALWDMVYRPQDDSLYFTKTDTDTLARLDLKTQTVSTVLSKSPLVPSPQALCAIKDHFYIADRELPTVYEVLWPEGKAVVNPQVTLNGVGIADHVVQLAYSDKTLYALQSGKVPLVRVGEKSVPVSLGTTWGFTAENSNTQVEPLITFEADQPVGFCALPNQPHKLYISQPHDGPNAIIDVNDYAYDATWPAGIDGLGSGSAMDYDFPDEKPKNTFRILLAGDSRTYIAPRVKADSKYDLDWFYKSPRTDTMAKQMERYLNTEAAVKGVKIHYQVLEWNRKGEALSSYAYYEILPLVKKYKIDLVLALTGRPGYLDYYMFPISKEGIPAKDRDYEYMLKPLSERVPADGAAADLYKRFKEKVKTDTEKLQWPGQDSPNGGLGYVCDADTPTRDDLIELSGRRLVMLSDEMHKLKTGNYNPQLLLFHVPFRVWNNDCVVSYWTDLGERFRLPFLDISEAFNNLKIAYYPALTQCCDGHYTYYGSKLIGYILSHDLIKDHYVPFEADKK